MGRLGGLFAILLLVMFVLITYVLQIAEANEYLGYRIFSMGSGYLIGLGGGCFYYWYFDAR
jgi:cytochrome c oxidase subunit IV